MRTSSGRILQSVAAVAGAAALAVTYTGTAHAATYEDGDQLEEYGSSHAAPELGTEPAAHDGELMSFAAPRLRSDLPGLGFGDDDSDDDDSDDDDSDDDDSDDDDSDDDDFRDDEARDRYSNSGDCYYEYDHTDHGYSFEFCDTHGDDEDFEYYDGYDDDHRGQ